MSLSLGGAYLPQLLDNTIEEAQGNDEYKKLNKGFSLNTNVHYLISGHVGFGLQYSFFTSGYKNNGSITINPYSSATAPLYSLSDINERKYINYAGLSAIFRQFLDNNRKFSLNETLSAGLLLYRAETQSSIFIPYYSSNYNNNIEYGDFRNINENTLTTGDTFGATFGLSAEYKILPYLSIGIGGNYMYGKLSRASIEYKNSFGNSQKVTDQKLATPVKLSRIDYSFVLRVQL